MPKTIDGILLDLIWVHLDLTHNRAQQLLTAAEAKCAERLPEATMSVTRNLANTQALVKVTGTGVFVGQLPGSVRNAVIRMYTETDHHEAVTMLQGPAWAEPWPETVP